MYKKNSNTWIYIAIGIAVCVILLLTMVQAISNDQSADTTTINEETEAETETETSLPSHGILIYKTDAGTVEYEEEWLVSDTDSETYLEVEEGSLVTLLITPADGKLLNSVDVTDYAFQTVESDLRTVSGLAGDGTEQMRLNFVMPSFDVIINFNYADAEPESEVMTETITEPAEAEASASESASDTLADETEAETEADTEQADIGIITDSASDTSDESDQNAASDQANDSATASAAENTGSGTTSSATTGTGSTYSATTRFDILSVSTVFLSYVTDEDAFYQAAFNYVLGKGLTGEIIGTMSSYSIDPENKTATIKILLNTGGTITGTYDKAANTYAFLGL